MDSVQEMNDALSQIACLNKAANSKVISLNGHGVEYDKEGRVKKMNGFSVTHDRNGRINSMNGHTVIYDKKGRVIRMNGNPVIYKTEKTTPARSSL